MANPVQVWAALAGLEAAPTEPTARAKLSNNPSHFFML
jgi:hypothetical protein